MTTTPAPPAAAATTTPTATTGPPVQQQIDDLKLKLQQVMNTIDELDEGSWKKMEDADCMYDIGAGTIGPGGINGTWIRPCKNDAIEGVQPQLCRVHAKKYLIKLLVECQAELKRLLNEPLHITAKIADVYDPTRMAITSFEYEEYLKNIKENKCVVTTTPGVVYGRTAAICKAFT